uniref:Ribosomal protein L14 n=1 Tax=Thraustochytrium aureum TaxID=42467 RepID=Q9G4D5_9STRA|nr:ribosomal protein L14 [Thraustochytrium aureum]
MVYPETNVFIVDNSNVKEVRCVHVYNQSSNNFGSTGSFIIGVITKLKKNNLKSTQKRGDLVKVLIVFTRKEKNNIKGSGIFVKAPKNFGILFDKKIAVGSRCKGVLPIKIKPLVPSLLNFFI